MAGQLTEAFLQKLYGTLSPVRDLGVPSRTKQHAVAVVVLEELETRHKVSLPRSGAE